MEGTDAPDRPYRPREPGRTITRTVLVAGEGVQRAAALQHEFFGSQTAVRGPVSPDRLGDGSRGDLVILDVAAGANAAVRAIERLRNPSSATMIVLVIPEAMAEYTWPLWEIGADLVLVEPLSTMRLADVCRRLLDRTGGRDRSC